MSSENPFVNRLKEKSAEHLKMMIASTSGFQPKAIEAAKFILEQREKGVSEYILQEAPSTYHSETKEQVSIFSKLNTSVKSIAIYQMVTGVLSLTAISSLGSPSVFENLLVSYFLIVNLLGFVGGLFLYKKNSKGFTISIIYHTTLGIVFGAGGLSYLAGGLFSFFLILTFESGFNFQFLFNFAPSISISFHDVKTIILGANFVSILALIVLFKAKDRFQKESIFDDELLNINFPVKNT